MAFNKRILYTKSFPSWDTPSGLLGSSLNEESITPIQLTATELKEPGSTITYTVTTGSLPTGLSLSSSGEISGTLTGYSQNETINFTVTATDDEGESVSRDFSYGVLLPYDIQYLSIAGGGGGGGNGDNQGGGGGGAGGYLTSTFTTSSYEQFVITVGSGGGSATSGNGGNGTNSSIVGPNLSVVSIGGGAGSGWYSNPNTGGSGGGARGLNSTAGAPGTPGQGNAGGSGSNTTSPRSGGGGGGAGSAGQNGVGGNLNTGNGGNGLASSITGSSVFRAGGGGGGKDTTEVYLTPGGSGGGGFGGRRGVEAGSGTANTGGGGGGEGGKSGVRSGSGGSGVVILRMPTVSYTGQVTGSPTVTTSGSDTILTYTGSGTYTS